ncbi:benzoate/H(+) symporter BenE family transporter [Domibacillus epiphyticus]|uniref:Benzoate transporter n=1 Tax=Domibacillus epiphyticus TaxID=1714355 RepID=A0A1V2A8K7_9BACI|nr:benzoate/H(+) symporter BenE family transporter [Domibacillus epiphyticus]OMP67260.1 benzoate transporter [Domibacillus epiphyticus]
MNLEMEQKRKSRSLKDINTKNISAGVVSGLLAATGPPVIILQAASNGNFSNEQTIFWMFSVYVFGGLFSIFLPLYYRIPIVGAHSISGVAFLATVAPHFTYSELIGSYFMSSVIIFLIGILGLFSRLLKYIPKEIIAAMLAGLITNYVVRFIIGLHHLPLIGGVALFVYFVFSKWNLRIPPVLAAIFTSFLLLFLTQDFQQYDKELTFVLPYIQYPDFNWLSILTVSFPLALLILSNDAAPGIGALEQNDYKPPTNRIVTLSGVFSMAAGLFGGQSANVAGMMSAICSSHEAGEKDKRYIAAIVSGILILLFGVFAWMIVPFINSLPNDFVSLLAGFALLGVLGSSLNLSFSKQKMTMSVTFTFVIALSNIIVFYISAPVWALTIGAIIANLVEKEKM